MSEYLVIYKDGSSKNDRKKESSAGIAFYIPSLKLLKSRHTTGTNSVAELLAIDYALWYAKEKLNNTKVHIHSDSEYAIGVLNEFGFIKGSYLSIKRIMRCNPRSKGGYDPIPIKEK